MTEKDFELTMKKYRREQEERQDRARSAMMRGLKDAGVTSVSVDFEGSGDSGNVEGIRYTPEIEGHKIVVPDTMTEATEWAQDGSMKRVTRNRTLDELVEEVCYSLLSCEHPGWEINEGSFGELSIDAEANKIALTFNQRIESVETYEERY